MGDVFKEQIVKKLPNNKDLLKRVGLIFLVFIVAIISLSVPVLNSFAFIIIAAAIFGVYYLFTFLKVEYEYIYTNGELDIDIIYSRAKRKRVFNGNVKDFEVMAWVDDKTHIGDFASATETKDYSSGVSNDHTYAFLATYKGKKTKIIVEPNDSMLQAFSMVLTPRKLFKKV